MSWQGLRVSADATHHTTEAGSPIYRERFDEVLKFHAPGLAPVLRNGMAWHIRTDGSAAYEERYQRTFGFYDGLAAVVTEAGWTHIMPDGAPAYESYFAWCGNFQGGLCSVRDQDGHYHHIDRRGRSAYATRWRYVGDFRDGIAVVQGDDGRSTHIRPNGSLLHHRSFLDLDVFHKGFARARDERGWMHVDVNGKTAYDRRFAAVEPFYNGQARVERFDGGLEVIGERGTRIVELRGARHSAFATLSSDLVGYWRTQAIAAAVRLGVFEALPEFYGTVASKCGVPPVMMLRMLRALAELGLVERFDAGWRATEKGAFLRRDHPTTLADAALEYAGPLGDAWRELDVALRNERTSAGESVFQVVAQDTDRLGPHHRMLQSYAAHDYPAVVAALDVRAGDRVLDAGGGMGTLARLVARRYPKGSVAVLDLPEVVAAAREANPDDGIEWFGGDVFGPWPTTADVVILARVLHDWDDERAVSILRNARASLPTGGRVHIVEMLLDAEAPDGGLCDLHLLAVTGGRERTLEDVIALLGDSGFAFDCVRRVDALPAIVTGVAR